MSATEGFTALKENLDRNLAELLGRMRLLEEDHMPDDWPAVKMEDITALCDAVVASNTRMAELLVCVEQAQDGLGAGVTRPHSSPEGCPTFYDCCHCSVESLLHNIERTETAEARVAELEDHALSHSDWERAHDLLDQHGVKLGTPTAGVHLIERLQAVLAVWDSIGRLSANSCHDLRFLCNVPREAIDAIAAHRAASTPPKR